MNAHRRFDCMTSRQSGFSLFEVLIAMVLLAVGLLGLAAMQVTGLASNQSAHQTSQSTLLAYDIADRVRANSSAAATYLTANTTLEEAVEDGVQEGCKTTTGCTPAQLAQNDLLEWHNSLASALPGATGTLVVADNIYTVAINWDQDRDGDADSDDPDFQMSFEP